MTDLLELALFSAVVIGALAWLVVAVVAPRRRPAQGSPVARTFLARAWLYAPVWVPLVVVAAALMPGVAGALGLLPGDHCLSHPASHHHLCVAHPPEEAGIWMTWALPLGALGVALAGLVVCGRRAWQQWRLARVLIQLSEPSSFGPDVRLIDQDAPLAVTLGLLRPTVLLSTGLLSRTSPGALDVVLAHERAHVARRDTLLSFLDQFAAALFPARVVGRLLADLTLAREQACDAVAARSTGRARVAAALAEVASLNMVTPAVGLSIAAGALEARVMHLLYPPAPTWRWVLAPATVLVTLVAAGVGPGHSVIEFLLTFLLH